MTATQAPERQTATPPPSSGAGAWARANLFSTWFNTVLTIVMGGVVLWAAIAVARFLANTDFTIIESNLRLFMVGQFPADQLWRPWLATAFIAVLIGGSAGMLGGDARQRAEISGVPYQVTRLRDIARRFWPIIALVVILLLFTTTLTPTILTIGITTVGLGSYYAGRALPSGARTWSWLFVVVMILAVYLALAGFGGVGWNEWGGLQLNLFLTVAGILFALPLGLLLALGRRSSLPVVRWFSVGYIEFIRGVPLITLLLAAAFAIGFLIPLDLRPSTVTRMLIAITLFEAAYIAEVVRGGFAAVPRGQIEASHALGLGPWKTMRLVALPQALRATIPAMVGQFISLFKDTTLVAILGVADLLHYAFIVNSQDEYVGKGLFVLTLGFAALIFWVGSYTMSRESQRLERKLGVGER